MVEKAMRNLDRPAAAITRHWGYYSAQVAEVDYTIRTSLLTARYDYASAVADVKQAMGTY
jgi:hypothetical protein